MRSVIIVIVRLVLLLDVPGSCGQSISTTRAPNRLRGLLCFPDSLPLCIESAPFGGLPAKSGLDGLDGKRRPEQHPDAQTGQQDQARRLGGHRALRWIPPRRVVS
jgi:hypothetical protein